MNACQDIILDGNDMTAYRTTSSALLDKFYNGELYQEQPEECFKMIIAITDHFKKGLVSLQNNINKIIKASYKVADSQTYGDALDFVSEMFESLEDDVEFICADFDNFQVYVLKNADKEMLERRCRIEFNLVQNLISDLDKTVERVRSDLICNLYSYLTDEEKATRAA